VHRKSYKKGDWKKWEEPFKTWMQDYIQENKKENARDFLDQLLEAIFDNLQIEDNLDLWLEQAIKKKLINDVWQISDNSFEEVICKVLTSLVYHNKRYSLLEEPCIGMYYYLFLLREWCVLEYKMDMIHLLNPIMIGIQESFDSDSPRLPEQVMNVLNRKEAEKGTYFGSYLSDDSDSDEEEQYKKNKLRLKLHQQKAKQIRKRIKDYEPITTRGTLYAANYIDNQLKSPRWLIQYPNLTEEQVADLEKLNDSINVFGMPVQVAVKTIKTKFFVAQYRGIAYTVDRWNQKARRNHRNKLTNNEVGKPQFSSSVYTSGGMSPCRLFTHSISQREQYLASLPEKANALKNKLLAARETLPVVRIISNVPYIYNNNAHFIQEFYTCNYDKFNQTIKKIILKAP